MARPLSSFLLAVTVMALLSAPAIQIIDTHGRNPMVQASVSVEGGIAAPVDAADWCVDTDTDYYVFGPYYFPPVLRAYEPADPALRDLRIPSPAAAPAELRQCRYYCEEADAYYPDVQTCATPWQRLAPHTP